MCHYDLQHRGVALPGEPVVLAMEEDWARRKFVVEAAPEELVDWVEQVETDYTEWAQKREPEEQPRAQH